jgi:hypothetical protein
VPENTTKKILLRAALELTSPAHEALLRAFDYSKHRNLPNRESGPERRD